MFEVDKVTVIGVGLIGGSLALALKRYARVGEIVGISRSMSTLEKAMSLNVIDRASQDIANEVGDSNIVVVAVPVETSDQIFQKIASGNLSGTIVTDVGSVKGSVIQSAKRHFGSNYNRFVPAHPIAGTEHSGVAAAFPELFTDRLAILVCDDHIDENAVSIVTSMWESVGSIVKFMNPDEHDAILSAASHLPHMLAFSLVHFIDNLPIGQKCFEFAAGGFYDFTRIASSDPDMWRDICVANSGAIVSHLDDYIEHLGKLRDNIDNRSTEEIHQIFANAKRARNEWLSRKNDS